MVGTADALSALSSHASDALGQLESAVANLAGGLLDGGTRLYRLDAEAERADHQKVSLRNHPRVVQAIEFAHRRKEFLLALAAVLILQIAIQFAWRRSPETPPPASCGDPDRRSGFQSDADLGLPAGPRHRARQSRAVRAAQL